jgi:hypothetical protein
VEIEDIRADYGNGSTCENGRIEISNFYGSVFDFGSTYGTFGKRSSGNRGYEYPCGSAPAVVYAGIRIYARYSCCNSVRVIRGRTERFENGCGIEYPFVGNVEVFESVSRINAYFSEYNSNSWECHVVLVVMN